MKKNIKYLIIGIIVLSTIITVFNILVFRKTTIDMTPTTDMRDLPPKLREELGYKEKPFIIELLDDMKFVKVIKEQKGLLLMDIGLSTVFTSIYVYYLYKKDFFNDNKKKSYIYFSIIMIVISLIIALKIYLKYSVQTIS